MTLSLVYRAARPSTSLGSTRVSLAAVSSRHASLSAIHKGLVQSEKARPQGARPGKISDLAEGSKRMTYAERQKARQQLAAERPSYKIRKGKKDITEYPDEAKPQSRRARFYDPNSSFGKKSLVYQLKTGKLGEGLKILDKKDGNRASDSAFQRTGPRPDLRASQRRMGRGRGSTGSARKAQEKEDVWDPVAELSRPAGFTRGNLRGDRDRSSDSRRPRRDGSGFTDRDALRRDKPSSKDRDTPFTRQDADRIDSSRAFKDRDAPFKRQDAPRQATDRITRDSGAFKDRDPPSREQDTTPRPDRGSRDAPREDRAFSNPRKDREPISIPYTTAASQFLYGKSVVEAALRSARRKLYKLYISKDATRPNEDISVVQNLARRNDVPITFVDRDGQRLMDKLAASRPHNGFVLEASPLPQPPLTALAPLPEDYATNPIVPLNLAHQSAEEAAINGTPSSVPSLSAAPHLLTTTTGTMHKPLVVVLDRILDPGNLGNILRSLHFLGASAVAVTRRGSASLTPVALKASSGASEAMRLFSVANLAEFVALSRASGWAVYAAVAGTPRSSAQHRARYLSVWEVDGRDPLRRDPCVLLIGNEAEGLDRMIVKRADWEVNIPNMSGAGVVDSLNIRMSSHAPKAQWVHVGNVDRYRRGYSGPLAGVRSALALAVNMRPLPLSLWLLLTAQIDALEQAQVEPGTDQHRLPTAIRKMPPDQGAKFHHEYCAFSDHHTAALSPPSHALHPAIAARSPYETDDARRTWANTSAELPLRPPFAVLSGPEEEEDDDESTSSPGWDLFRRAASALAFLERRQWACPSGTRNCSSIGYPNSCCGESETCMEVPDTGLGPVGCCPSGATCGGGISGCADGSTACGSEIGGGCCIPGFVCQGVGLRYGS
ncbi:hypothetical protein N658DRAFT_484252 [Parathielavia hyrcaniae]|uniref:rRNA methyltransferase 1, mitochondrial n=1 Tax=Parathielavia hyrcaniae TaxID=113614 RepID=A0AAN6T4Z2_9PEZI|nr:hypothetical protein N658DRAFT_484252 [Parathielavia hyrcaniae]